MSEPVLVPFGGGEVVGDSSDRRVEILSEHETLHATWSRFGPRRDGDRAVRFLDVHTPSCGFGEGDTVRA